MENTFIELKKESMEQLVIIEKSVKKKMAFVLVIMLGMLILHIQILFFS